MADIHKNPYESVDLALLLTSYGDSIGTFYPVAYVYDPNNNLVDGSPFTLTLVDNNLYVLNNAFQCRVDSGSYKIVYIVYTDAGHTTRSTTYGERVDTITVSIQSTTGLGNNQGSSVYYNDEPLRKLVKDYFDKIEKKVSKLQKDFDAGLKMEVDQKDLSTEITKLSTVINGKSGEYENLAAYLKNINTKLQNFEVIQSSVKKSKEDLLTAIKKNRSAIIKNKFDKALLLPMINTLADDTLKRQKEFKNIKMDLTNTLDMKVDESMVKFGKVLEKNNNFIIGMMNKLNESMRIKLKYAIDQLSLIVLRGTRPKQNINITVKKEE